nr:MAG TPA: putative translation initiation factor 2 domain protein [Caudoviricetes sp.]
MSAVRPVVQSRCRACGSRSGVSRSLLQEIPHAYL